RDLTPALTTVRVPLEELGRRALRLALGDPDADGGTVQTEVVLRDSTPGLPR
ncbi:MAG: LacI family transcriptional regulator, partial [Agromyces sp.]|nr:LacI family transcriptional regulator [Agromyces sp.]